MKLLAWPSQFCPANYLCRIKCKQTKKGKHAKKHGLCLVLKRDVRYSFPFVLIVKELCWQKHFAHEIRGMEGEGKATLIGLKDLHVAWQIEQVEEVGSGFLTSQLTDWCSQFNWFTLWHKVPWLFSTPIHKKVMLPDLIKGSADYFVKCFGKFEWEDL